MAEERGRDAFAEAAAWFQDTVDHVPGERWGDPGLGEWSVRDLVGHTVRALTSVTVYLGRPAEQVVFSSAGEYFRAGLAQADPAAVAERGRASAAELGADPAAAVRRHVAAVLVAVAARPDDAICVTSFGAICLGDYLVTRTFELTVHTLDLRAAIGLALDVPAVSAAACLDVVVDLAVEQGAAGVLLLASTGRRLLPAEFSVL